MPVTALLGSSGIVVEIGFMRLVNAPRACVGARGRASHVGQPF